MRGIGWAGALAVAATLTVTARGEPPEATVAPLPPPVRTIAASRRYPLRAEVVTNQRGWDEALAYVTVPQTARLSWQLDAGGARAELWAREAWNATAPWQRLRVWHARSADDRGEATLAIVAPTVLRLRARAPAWPQSGIARFAVDYERPTLAVLRGDPGRSHRPVLVCEGFDPFNSLEANDPFWYPGDTLSRLVETGRRLHDLDLWLVDWGDGGAEIELLAEDVTEILRLLRAEGGRTVALGISMGAIVLRWALARAYDRGEPLGVARYLSVNGPHRGAWINSHLWRYALQHLPGIDDPHDDAPAPAPGMLGLSALASPAAQELVIDGLQSRSFLGALRLMGDEGYDPTIPRVAFTNGNFGNLDDGTDTIRFREGEPIHHILIRPLWLPMWTTVHRVRSMFRYDHFPGDRLENPFLLDLRRHFRLFGIARIDARADFLQRPTFIPTHSALDFPDTLIGGPERFRYARRDAIPFTRVYLAPRSRGHHDLDAGWIEMRSGRGTPTGENALVYEAALAFRDEGPRRE